MYYNFLTNFNLIQLVIVNLINLIVNSSLRRLNIVCIKILFLFEGNIFVDYLNFSILKHSLVDVLGQVALSEQLVVVEVTKAVEIFKITVSEAPIT